MGQNSGDTEISQLDHTSFRQEDILTFDVSMKNLPVVDVFHPQAELCEPVENLAFTEVATSLTLDPILQITSICIVHHDVELLLLCFVNFSEHDNVRMIKSSQDLCFFHCFFPFLRGHLLDAHLFNDTFLL